MAKVLERLRQLTPVAQRRAASILGAVVADVAITPLHWIYDQDKVAHLVSKGTAEFSETSYCPYYTVQHGEPSAYGSQLQLTIRELAENKSFNGEKMADCIYKTFGPDTIYETARKQTASPKPGPWTNHNIKIFIAKRENGDKPEADGGSKDPDGLMKSIAVVAFYYGREELLRKVEECVRVTQSNPVAVGYALVGARILNQVIATGNDPIDDVIAQVKGGDFPFETDEKVLEDVGKAMAAKQQTHPQAVKNFGLSCAFPGSFLGMVHGVVTATDYRTAVRDELLAGGDNCARIGFIGAYAGARFGLDSIPEEWVSKVKNVDQILKDIKTIVTSQ